MEYLHQSIVYYLLNNFQEAYEIFNWINESKVKNKNYYYYYKGLFLMMKKENLKAIQIFKLLINNDPLIQKDIFILSFQKLFNLYSKMKFFKRKKTLVKKLQEIKHSHPIIYRRLENLLNVN